MKYKTLGRSGLKVSELCLGTMGFGTENGWGADKQVSKQVFDTYVNAGGNFLDTANIYTQGTSEVFLSEFIASERDNYVVATKYSLYENTKHPNASGNSRKNMMNSVEASLKRLKTEYIDLMYLHIWDNLTPVDEVLRGLDDLVKQGKIMYIGISDTPAWVVSKANTMADLMGWSQFIGLQVEYSLVQRTVERELIPMAQHYNMTVLPWAPLAGGALSGKYLRGEKGRIKETSNRLNERSTNIAREVVSIADELGVAPSSVALKWLMQQAVSCIPIVGATKPLQVEENLKCVDVTLSSQQMDRLNKVSAYDLGFPAAFFEEDAVKKNLFGGFYNQVEQRAFVK
ncbi:aryl-alcohol dehydrogenase-like predicted oxidoreductase [Mucilaginibacter gracilis]|uniref:Aryl-alcohol dehydrogenase-like predicted oxidoreductase n=2 Tax=Mucilaginibacter gracilis TaxID=423350 RepID=A0A495IYB5_9SPHI|nr:aryl-alcohol dehydrogenase-like predicted oxidoreductase [Mucilaginibacter gracilis]